MECRIHGCCRFAVVGRISLVYQQKVGKTSSSVQTGEAEFSNKIIVVGVDLKAHQKISFCFYAQSGTPMIGKSDYSKFRHYINWSYVFIVLNANHMKLKFGEE